MKTKVKVVVYENPDRVEEADKLAQLHEISRAELYRRAMRLMLAKCRDELQEDQTNDRK